ncbi:CsiV family protein [Thalassotalea aquiviva]|uniref:CsiV family protein n=1 Tax=Thalassotalea aquiviva TaxID=3242415 RepID=UPI00352A3CDF
MSNCAFFNLANNPTCERKTAMTQTFAKKFVSLASASVLLSSSLLSAQALAANSDDARWFEIEVILIQQLGDQSRSDEHFAIEQALKMKDTQAVNLIHGQMQKTRDSRYLLGACMKDDDPLTIKLDKPLHWQQIIKMLPVDNVDETATTPSNQPVNQQQDLHFSTDDAQAFAYSSQNIMNVSYEVESDNHLIDVQPQGAVLQQPALSVLPSLVPDNLLGQESQAESLPLGLDCYKNDLEEVLMPLDEVYSEIPTTISGSEDLHAQQPYLLSRSSFQLRHIFNSLKRSAEFRPLLHMAWRQPVYSQRWAKPVKLMAGPKVSNISTIESSLAQNNASDLTTATKQPQTNELELHINQIIEQVQAQKFTPEKLVNELKDNKLTPVKSHFQERNSEQQNDLQTWMVEGLFKVHLNHYLFIDSELNFHLPNPNATPGEPSGLLIPFNQNRRVISNEIHYFDHPYVGLIVQIRRHQRPD